MSELPLYAAQPGVGRSVQGDGFAPQSISATGHLRCTACPSFEDDNLPCRVQFVYSAGSIIILESGVHSSLRVVDGGPQCVNTSTALSKSAPQSTSHCGGVDAPRTTTNHPK